jgi:formate dehydrogenase major subunit
MSRVRGNVNPFGAATIRGLHSKWGHAWLLNRRIFYNNNGVATFGNATGDAADLFVAPDQVARLFVHLTSDATSVADYAWFYRAYSKLGEADGRTPKHWEPWESLDEELYGDYQPEGIAPLGNYVNTSAERATYPLTYTTFRQVEHYQGGAMSRNVPYLTELQPNPILEINSVDAAALGVENGAQVWLHSIRTEGLASLPDGVGPFIAEVGAGDPSLQRIGKGVVGSTYAWGEVGLKTSTASANKLTIDALDKNTFMPETKVCVVRVSKVTNP